MYITFTEIITLCLMGGEGGGRGERGGEGVRNEVPLVSGSHYNWVGGAFSSIRFNFIEKSPNMYDAEKLDFAH